MDQSSILSRRAVLRGLSSILPLANACAVTGALSQTQEWPSGWDDPRFADNSRSASRFNNGGEIVTWRNLTVIDSSGNPSFGYRNYSLIDCRMRTREGPRVSGSNILIDGCYIEAYGSETDHADGIQAYGGSTQQNFKNVVIRNTKIVLTTGALNAGIFFSDHSGVDLTLDNIYVDGSISPNGAIWLPCSESDIGCKSLIARHVRVKSNGMYGPRGFRLDPDPSLCNIIEWTDVCWTDGRPIRRPA